jgi:hypothetical protein
MEGTKLLLSIANEFSETPGPRSRVEGDFSGELFLEELLLPRYAQALAQKTALTIDLDGTEGYATSFLESAFGGLARSYEPEQVLKTINFKSEDEPYLIEEIKKYIGEARRK